MLKHLCCLCCSKQTNQGRREPYEEERFATQEAMENSQELVSATAAMEDDKDETENDDDDESSPSSGSLSDEQRPLERDYHSYLPGPSHPLLHTRQRSRAATDNRDESEQQQDLPSCHGASLSRWVSLPSQPQATATTPETTLELAILELPGVVLFPGATIPIRLSNRSWIQHLGRQIDASRKVGSLDFGRVVQLGIVTQQREQNNNNNNQPTETRARFEDARRRSSFLRRGVRNSQQQRRLSRILRQELLLEPDSDNSGADNSNSSSDQEGSDTGAADADAAQTTNRRSLHPYIGRVGTIATVTYTHGDAILDQRRSGYLTQSNSSRVWQQHAEEQGELILQAVGTTRFRVEAYMDFQSFADVQVFCVQEYRQDQHSLSCPSLSNVMRRTLPLLNPDLINHHDDDDGDERTRTETASDIISKTPPRRWNKVARKHPASTINTNKYYTAHHQSLIRQLSLVTPIPLLAFEKVWPWRLVGQIVSMIQKGGREDHDTMSGATSLVTSLAALLQESENASLLDHPTAFSFWMAAQMPLGIDDKYHLLQLQTTVERLLKLRDHLNVCTSHPTAICCKSCHIPLSTVDSVFTVGGAEGTTGNYVNELGFIHQVVTLRRVDDEHRKLYCSGAASTANSYFPGYSWTITYCARCGSLLGWKFNWVGLDDDVVVDDNDDIAYGDGHDEATEEVDMATTTTMGRSRATRRRRRSRRQSQSENKPSCFFGFMASSLFTEQSSEP
jgi:ATP-dependent protease La (LON) substrate-binding domain/Yippee zinc-binding/DNA-binding /Mis18, centromere assembly